MITNERQYKLTRSEAERFAERLRHFDIHQKVDADIDPRILEMQRDALASQLEEMQKNLREYEQLKTGEIKVTPVSDLNDLPQALIRARIASGLTQADLAEKLGIKEQQIQRYESEKYYSASLRTLSQIANALSLKLEGSAAVSPSQDESGYWSAFPITEMYKRRWFEDFKGSLQAAKENAEEILRDFFSRAEFHAAPIGLHRKNVRSGALLNEYALRAWEAYVLIKAREKIDRVKEFKKRSIDSEWINSLVKLSADNRLEEIEGCLAEKGIIFIILPHLQGTHLDGAALLLEKKHPVIAVTLRYDRIDNFWFVLLHELAHVLLHLDNNSTFFDDLDSDANEIEKEADEFALEALIPDKVWKTSLARFSLTEKAVERQAKVLGIHPAIVAGRIRRETNNYIILNELIGLNKVREKFLTEFIVE